MLNWNDIRAIATLAVVFCAILEPVSLIPLSNSPCLVNPNNYRSEHSNKNKCPPFHTVIIKNAPQFFDVLGDSEWLTAIATAVIAWFTVILAGMSRRQISDGRSVQRGHVYVQKINWTFLFDNSGQPTDLSVSVVLKCSGVTPVTTTAGLFGVSYVPQNNEFVFGDPNEAVRQSLVFGGGQEIETPPLTIGMPHVHSAAARTGRQFLWGLIRYRDVFFGTPEHILEFCYQLRIEGVPPSAGDSAIHFDPFGPHNRFYDDM